jgi:hypothetical protein
MRSVEILQRGVESLASCLDERGELVDPVIGYPFQYGTAYYAYCNAVLAHLGEMESRAVHADRAIRGLNASLDHVEDPQRFPSYSGVDTVVACAYQSDHRDFFWPAMLRTYRLLRDLGGEDLSIQRARIAAIDPEATFASRPPSNWSSVWLSGEWIRMQEGLSAFPRKRFEEYLEAYLPEMRLQQGFFEEPGHPNSYDLFTRYHFGAILVDGYDGPLRETLTEFMQTGTDRSLGVQLSDGSLASAHRSTGQTWTLGAQAAFLAQAASLFTKTDPARARAAQEAAVRAARAMGRWQRPNGPFSPLENVLPPGFRVGYENYTAEANYSALALAFLARALTLGLDDFPNEARDTRPAATFVEHDPTYRGLVHRGPYSVHVNAFPNPHYDGFGIVDLTLGEGRSLHFASSVRHVQSGRLLNLGLALRRTAGPSDLTVMAEERMTLVEPIRTGEQPGSLFLLARPNGRPFLYRLNVSLTEQGVAVEEATPGHLSLKTLLIPYLRDNGDDTPTILETRPKEIVLRHGAEEVAIVYEEEAAGVRHLPYGYENRRGLCGLVRVDFASPTDKIAYSVTRR